MGLNLERAVGFCYEAQSLDSALQKGKIHSHRSGATLSSGFPLFASHNQDLAHLATKPTALSRFKFRYGILSIAIGMLAVYLSI